MLNKKAGIEESSVVDSRTNLKIHVSTTARLIYINQYFDGDRMGMSNVELNDFIAKDFLNSASAAEHMFLARSSEAGSGKREWIEVRKVLVNRPFKYFFSIIKRESINIIFISTDYKKPKKKRKVIRNVDES